MYHKIITDHVITACGVTIRVLEDLRVSFSLDINAKPWQCTIDARRYPATLELFDLLRKDRILYDSVKYPDQFSEKVSWIRAAVKKQRMFHALDYLFFNKERQNIEKLQRFLKSINSPDVRKGLAYHASAINASIDSYVRRSPGRSETVAMFLQNILSAEKDVLIVGLGHNMMWDYVFCMSLLPALRTVYDHILIEGIPIDGYAVPGQVFEASGNTPAEDHMLSGLLYELVHVARSQEYSVAGTIQSSDTFADKQRLRNEQDFKTLIEEANRRIVEHITSKKGKREKWIVIIGNDHEPLVESSLILLKKEIAVRSISSFLKEQGRSCMVLNSVDTSVGTSAEYRLSSVQDERFLIEKLTSR